MFLLRPANAVFILFLEGAAAYPISNFFLKKKNDEFQNFGGMGSCSLYKNDEIQEITGFPGKSKTIYQTKRLIHGNREDRGGHPNLCQ